MAAISTQFGFRYGSSRGTPLFPLDQLGLSALGAYSLRMTNAAYTGPCLRVRRESDNAETNIGFAGAGLDSAALLTFVGASGGRVVTWFDQSGNARHLGQAAAADQARIVNAGTNLGAVTVDSGTVQRLQVTHAAFALAALPLTVSSVLKSVSLGGSALGLLWNLGTAAGARIFPGTDAGTRNLILRPNATNQPTSPTQTLLAGGNVLAWTKGAAADASAVGSYLNGVGPSTYPADPIAATDNSFGINGSSNPIVSGAHAHQELILFGSVLSPAQLSTLSRNQGAYFGVTVA